MIMMVIAALLTSLTVAREWERGTMEQLISTPIKGNELILGKLLPYFAIGMLDVLVAMVHGRGSCFRCHCAAASLLVRHGRVGFLVGALSLGMLVSIVTKSQLLANQLAMVLTFCLRFCLSGLCISISNMPRPIQMRHLLRAGAVFHQSPAKAIYLKGVGLQILAGEAVLLTSLLPRLCCWSRSSLQEETGRNSAHVRTHQADAD